MSELEEQVEKWVMMIKDDFGVDQIQTECFHFCMRKYFNPLTLEETIYLSMRTYAEVIKRSKI